jgi:hypothetical protein
MHASDQVKWKNQPVPLHSELVWMLRASEVFNWVRVQDVLPRQAIDATAGNDH